MNKLNLILILIFCITFRSQYQIRINTRESKFIDVLNDSIKGDKIQITKSEYGLIGKWFIPHAADINITFNKDRTFIFNHFNIKTEEIEVLHGMFELNGNRLILIYDNRTQQTFKFQKGKGADDNYYIIKGDNYYFVKSNL